MPPDGAEGSSMPAWSSTPTRSPAHVDALRDVLYGLRSQVLHLKNVVISPAQVHPVGVVVSDCTVEAGHLFLALRPFRADTDLVAERRCCPAVRLRQNRFQAAVRG